ncbi:hypothetical protein [Nitrosophilus labii]|uniref:hypothetical protein n=1 Tax=Nitrosophilus labii TaxID=2706014 RepID=UPI001656DDD1|nr:hypothetical protein [Nitrosophilus labii]
MKISKSQKESSSKIANFSVHCQLYNFAYKVAKSKIDLKEVLIKSTLKLTRDFIDYILDKKTDYDAIKSLISLIDIYLVQVDRAYSKYYQEIEDELNKMESEKSKKDEEIIIALFQNSINSNNKVDIIDFYKDVLVVCKSFLKRVEDKEVVLDIQKCNYNTFKEE